MEQEPVNAEINLYLRTITGDRTLVTVHQLDRIDDILCAQGIHSTPDFDVFCMWNGMPLLSAFSLKFQGVGDGSELELAFVPKRVIFPRTQPPTSRLSFCQSTADRLNRELHNETLRISDLVWSTIDGSRDPGPFEREYHVTSEELWQSHQRRARIPPRSVVPPPRNDGPVPDQPLPRCWCSEVVMHRRYDPPLPVKTIPFGPPADEKKRR
jgi:hypothetical protein